jgi:hypothetical protein
MPEYCQSTQPLVLTCSLIDMSIQRCNISGTQYLCWEHDNGCLSHMGVKITCIWLSINNWSLTFMCSGYVNHSEHKHSDENINNITDKVYISPAHGGDLFQPALRKERERQFSSSFWSSHDPYCNTTVCSVSAKPSTRTCSAERASYGVHSISCG